MLPFIPSMAQDLNISIAMIPVQSYIGEDGQPKRTFVELAEAMSETYKDGKISCSLYSFARSINNVASSKFEAHLPLIKNPDITKELLPFNYSSKQLPKSPLCYIQERINLN